VDETADSASSYPGLLMVASGLSLAAGMVHITVIPEYLGEWWGYGFFFMVVALLQLTYGLVLMMRPWAFDDTGAHLGRPHAFERRIYLIGAIGNLAIVGLYLITRTLGIPLLGPEAGDVEPFTPLSVSVTLLEAFLGVALLVLAHRTESGSQTEPAILEDLDR
jgi:hypothetical protein